MLNLLIFCKDGSRNRITENLPLVFALFIFFAYQLAHTHLEEPNMS